MRSSTTELKTKRSHPLVSVLLNPDAWLVTSFFLDGVVAASGMSVMVLQGKAVQIPNALYLAAFQFCFIIPQLLMTPLVDWLSRSATASKILLAVSLAASFAAAQVLLQSLATGSLPLFFIARFISGAFRHPKILFARAREGSAAPAFGDLGQVGLLAMHTGFIASAVLGDKWLECVSVQEIFVQVQLVALAVGWGNIFLARSPATKKDAAKVSSPCAAVTSMRGATALLLSPPTAPTRAVWASLSVYMAVRIVAAVNQCLYPVIGPGLGLPFILVALHLIIQDKVGQWFAAPVLRRVTSPARRKQLMILCCTMLQAGIYLAPRSESADLWTYYPVTLVLIDWPTSLLDAMLREDIAAIQDCHPQVKQGIAAGLLTYLMIFTKLMGAPMRLWAVANPSGWLFPVHKIAVPTLFYVHGAVGSRRIAGGLVLLFAVYAFPMVVVPWGFHASPQS